MKKLFKKRIIFWPLVSGLAAGFVFFGVSAFFGASVFNYSKPPVEADNSHQVLKEKVFVPTHLKTPSPLRGIYMTSWVASTREWRARMVKMVEETELNAIVIDVKDYSGRIAFEVDDPDLKKTGAVENRIDDARKFLASLHSKGIYAIARISVFQDPYMAKKRPDLTVKRKNGKAWKDYKGVEWIDPCAKEYWNYIIKIAKASERAGFDELNFDYIRFPSDGNMKDIRYTFCPAKVSKADLLENFFGYLSKNLKDTKLPLSADLFGMVTVNTDDLNIGQVLEKAAPYFDYIAPMVYPSHYPRGFDGYKNPALHPYKIIYQGMKKASERLLAASSTPNKLRPWLQDFDLGAKYTAEMVRKEKQAVYDAGLSSWVLWNAGNKYTRGALDKHIIKDIY